MPELDRVIHEPARLRILSLLPGGTVDFTFLMKALGLPTATFPATWTS